MIDIEEIVNTMVEKRVIEIIERAMEKMDKNAITSTTFGTREIMMNRCEAAVASLIQRLAKEEVEKHESKIREEIVRSLSSPSACSFKIDAYVKLETPKC